MFGLFKKRAALKHEATVLYEKAALQARQPVFYTSMGVPDTIDGRFEMVTVHVGLFIQVLNQQGRKDLAQALFDVNFKTTDRALRQMGVGDLSVPKHMKRMMKGFKGRAQNFADALNNSDDKALNDAVRRNVFGTIEAPDQGHIDAVANYSKNLWNALKLFDNKPLNDFVYPDIEGQEKKSA